MRSNCAKRGKSASKRHNAITIHNFTSNEEVVEDSKEDEEHEVIAEDNEEVDESMFNRHQPLNKNKQRMITSAISGHRSIHASKKFTDISTPVSSKNKGVIINRNAHMKRPNTKRDVIMTVKRDMSILKT